MKCIHLQQRKCTSADAFAFGTIPHPRVCSSCDRYEGADRGLGDTVHRMAEATGVAGLVRRVAGGDCGGCSKRRQWLNGKVAFGDGGGHADNTVYEEGDAGDEHG
jgi:hypothetical protein